MGSAEDEAQDDAPDDGRGRDRARVRRVAAVAVPVVVVATAIAAVVLGPSQPRHTVQAAGSPSDPATTTTSTTIHDEVRFEDPTTTAVSLPERPTVTSTSLRLPRPTVPTVPTIPKVVAELLPTTTTAVASACPVPPAPWSVTGTGVYTVPTSGGEGRRLQPYPQGAGEPQSIVHSPDGRHLAITRLTGTTDGGEFTSLHLAAVDGTGERELAPATRSPRNVAWSPDGTRLVLQEEGPERGQLSTSVVDVATETVTRLAVHGYGVGFPRWSPDSRRVAWAGMQDPTGVFVADVPSPASGSGAKQIDPAPTQDVSWSPDGSELAVARYGGGGGPRVAEVMRVDGTARRVVHEGAVRVAWSPANRAHLVTDTSGQLHLTDPDGGGARYLGGGNVHGWLPGGTEVVTTSAQGIHLVDLRGCARTLVAGSGSELGLRSWSPDGNSVLFVRFA